MAKQVQKVEAVQPGVKAVWMPGDVKDGFICESTLPLRDPGERAAVLEIIEGDSIPGESLIGSEFYLGQYVCHPIELADEATGEVVQAIRTLLVQPHGPPVSFVSVGVLKSIARIAWASGRVPPFEPPQKVRLVQRATGRGRRTYKLVPVAE